LADDVAGGGVAVVGDVVFGADILLQSVQGVVDAGVT
jgi:hypothetical protein